MSNKLLSLLAAMAPPVLAVDTSISGLCSPDLAGSTYQRAGGFCDAVGNNHSLASGPPHPCPPLYARTPAGCVLVAP